MVVLLALSVLVLATATAARAGVDIQDVVVHGFGADTAEILAAREVRRYLGLLAAGDGTAALALHDADDAGMASVLSGTKQGAFAVVTATRHHPIHSALRLWDSSFATALDAAEHRDSHLLHSLRAPRGGGTVVICTGASPRATLYAAYSLVEHLGVRFHLPGDVLPSPAANLALPPPGFSQPWTPRFTVRGLQPFHDFPMGAALQPLPSLRCSRGGTRPCLFDDRKTWVRKCLRSRLLAT